MKLVDWIRTHRWETVSIGLATALVMSLVSLAVVASDRGDVPLTDGTTTTVVSVSTTTTTLAGPGSTIGADEPSDLTTTTEAPTLTDYLSTAVIVDNTPGVGYQIGIGAAEILIEVPVEGGMTRYTAIFGSDVPELVGPVRSLRPVSADLLALFDPVLFSTGGQPFVMGMVAATGAQMVTPETSPAFQALERPRPHHLFITPGAESLPETVDLSPWAWGEWQGGEPATVVELPGGVEWRFEGGSYVKYVDGLTVEYLPSFDADPVPLSRDTLIVMEVNQKSAGYFDSAGFEVPTFDVVGSGVVSIYHRGEVVAGRWSRASQDLPYMFTDQADNVLAVPPTRTILVLTSTD